MAIVARELPAFPADNRWSCGNSGYRLAARTMEKRSGQPQEQLPAVSFHRPLALPFVHHCKQAPVLPRDANGHACGMGAVVVVHWESMSTTRGNGGLCGNAIDLARRTRRLARGAGTASAAVSRPSGAGGSARRRPLGGQYSRLLDRGRANRNRLHVNTQLPGFSGELRYQGGARFFAFSELDVRSLEFAEYPQDEALTIGMGDTLRDARPLARTRRRRQCQCRLPTGAATPLRSGRFRFLRTPLRNRPSVGGPWKRAARPSLSGS